MAKVRRFSGNLKIELSFNDRTNQYRAKLCPLTRLWRGKAQEPCETVYVRPPRSMERAVDSPRAYDDTARAAISFARPDVQEYAWGDRKGRTWHISRGRHRYVKGHPKAKRS